MHILRRVISRSNDSIALSFGRTSIIGTKRPYLMGTTTNCANDVRMGKITMGDRTPLARITNDRIGVANGCIGAAIPRNSFFVDSGAFCLTSGRDNISLGNFHTCMSCVNDIRIGHVLVSVSNFIASVGKALRSRVLSGPISICALDNLGIEDTMGHVSTLSKLRRNICVVGNRGMVGW